MPRRRKLPIAISLATMLTLWMPCAILADTQDEPVAFAPGVRIDWQRRQIHVQTTVVLRQGALEFLACWPGKEHESILRFEADAVHVYMALGLIGLQPGHPPCWNPQRRAYDPPAGDLLDISLEWEDADGRQRSDAYQWLRELRRARPPLPRPWIFAGSLLRADNTLASQYSGVGIALVDFPDSFICFSRRHPSRYGELWAVANTPVIPPVGTPVRLILRAARPRHYRVVLDRWGMLWVNGCYCEGADLANLLQLARQLRPNHVQLIEVRGPVRGYATRVLRQLTAAGLPPDAVRFQRGPWRLRPGC